MNEKFTISTLQEGFKLKTVLIVAAVMFVIGILITGGLMYSHYSSVISDKDAQIKNYYETYAKAQLEKEQLLISKAQADLKANTPIKEYVYTNSTAQLSIVPKKDKDDADVEINQPPTKVKVSYNGKVEELTGKTVEGQWITDGKLLVTQSTEATLNVTEIVNREIAQTINRKDGEISSLKKSNTRNKILFALGGIVVGVLAKDKIKSVISF